MKRVLLLMSHTTYKAGAFLAAARSLGCAATVGTDRSQVLSNLDPAGNLLLPFHDVARAVDRIREHQRHSPVDAILAADDEGVLLAATASEALGLRGNPPMAVRDATDKLRTRQVLAGAGLPTPRFLEVRDASAGVAAGVSLGYPCVVKPRHLSASRGVMRADDGQELQRACDRLRRILEQEPAAARSQSWLIESYIAGSEFALEAVLCQGTLHRLAVFDKPDPLEGPFFQETFYITPSRLDGEQVEALWIAVGNAVHALQLQEGPVHAEVRHATNGDFVLEVAPRSIGGRCSTALRFGRDATHSLEEELLACALGLQHAPQAREETASGVLMIPIPNAGILRTWEGEAAAAAVPFVTAVERTLPLGQFVQPPPEGGQYLGFVFARAPHADQVEEALRRAHACLHIHIEATTAPQRPMPEETP